MINGKTMILIQNYYNNDILQLLKSPNYDK